MTHFLVLIANPARADLHDSTVGAVRDALMAAGVKAGAPATLAAGVAAEIPFDGEPALALTAASAALKDAPVDAAAVPAARRRKKLLIADMESTLIENEFLDDIAARAGVGEQIAEITRRAMAGELDFAGALRARVAMLKGLNARVLEDIYTGLRVTPGAVELIATMRAHGAATAIVSGGFRIFAERVRKLLGADSVEANELGVADGLLTGLVGEPIFDRPAKRTALERIAAARGAEPADALAVGDGANDLDMVRAAGLGVGFRAKKVLADAADANVRHGDLTALLYLQGYRREEFRGADA